MDPKQALIDCEKMIDRARATKVVDRESHQAQREKFLEARELLNGYFEWRKNGGFEPPFTNALFPKATADTFAAMFDERLRSYGC